MQPHAWPWIVIKATAAVFGVSLGTRAVVKMGCFQSSDAKHEADVRAHESVPLAGKAGPVGVSGVSLGSKAGVGAEAEAEADADASGQVVSVPRAAVTVGERERAELRVKNMRDKLTSTIIRSEQVMHEEGRLALRLRREGRLASAKILIQRRQLLKAKIDRAETQLSTVYDMIEGMEQAQDNRNLMLAIEQGTQAINDITKDVSVERMQSALADNREAIQYVDTLGHLLREDAQQIEAEFDYDAAFEQLEEQLDEEQTPTAAAAAAVDNIPDAPTTVPEEPYPPAPLPNQPHAPTLA